MFFSRFQRGFSRSPHVWPVLIVASFANGFHSPANAQETARGDIIRIDSPEYTFSAEDELLLDSIQRGCFNYLWQEVGETGKLAKDRRTTVVASTAGVGFQLSSLPIGVERGWISKDEGRKRAETILRTLEKADNNRRWGVFLHFVQANDARLYPPYDNEISTVDHALLLAGAMPAAVYFGGDVAEAVDRLAAATQWPKFQLPDTGFLSFAWEPDVNTDVSGTGKLMEHSWRLATDEERLIYFVAAGTPDERYAVDPAMYYRLERHVDRLNDMQPFVVSWNGALFTYFFSHCWINYYELTADNPGKFGVSAPRVDWLENSRRATLSHRQRCIEYASKFKTLAPNRWGLAPCMGYITGNSGTDYLVPDIFPNLSGIEQLHEGTVAPYAAGSVIMFTPQESMDALREFRYLTDASGKPLTWQDPTQGGYGFVDSFNLDQGKACDDNVAIDVGPMLLAIENVRTGLIWRLFMQHDIARRAVSRLQLESIR